MYVWIYLHSIVWEGECQQVTGRTGVTVLHRAQTIRSDLQQHVRRLHVKHLTNRDKNTTNQSELGPGKTWLPFPIQIILLFLPF